MKNRFSIGTCVMVCVLFAACGRPASAAQFPNPSFYEWSAGNPPTTMTPTSDSFCFLTSTTGSFNGLSDQSVVSTGHSAYWNATAWEIYGAGGAVQVEAECIFQSSSPIGWADFPGGGMSTYWLAGNGIPGSNTMETLVPTAGHFCFLLAFSGKFASFQDFAIAYPFNGNWVQSIEDNHGEIVSEVGCVATTRGLDPPAGSARFCSEDGAACAGGSVLPSYFTDVCAMNEVLGDWQGTGRSSYGQIQSNGTTGAQNLVSSISGAGAGVQSICAGP